MGDLMSYKITAKQKLEKLLDNPKFNVPQSVKDGLRNGTYTVTPKVYHVIKAVNGVNKINMIALSDTADDTLCNLNNAKITNGTYAFIHNVCVESGETSETDATVANAVNSVTFGKLAPALQLGVTNLKFGKQEVYEKTSNSIFNSKMEICAVDNGDVEFVPRMIDDKTNIDLEVSWRTAANAKTFMRVKLLALVVTANTIGL